MFNWVARMMVWRGYVRAAIVRAKGANISGRVNFGRNVRCDRPKCLKVGERSVCEDLVWFKITQDDAAISLGKFTYVGRGSEIDASGSITIGDHTLIAPGCFITDHNHGIDGERRIDQQKPLISPVRIGSDVWLGARVCVLPGVTIGDGAVVGAGAVVCSDIPPYSVAVGVPARAIHKRPGCGEGPSRVDTDHDGH